MPAVLNWIIVTSVCLVALLIWGLFAIHTLRSQMERRHKKRFVILSGGYLLGWLLLALFLAGNGVFQADASSTFPLIALGIALPLLAGVLLLRYSPTLNSVIESVPIPWLVGVQLYRILGLTFLVLFALDSLPAEFAIPAGVGDVLVGLTAPLAGYLFFKGYRGSCLAVLGWNIAGIADLVIAVIFGFVTSPGPFQLLALDAPNELITAYPLVLIPVFAVPLSILLHLAALKRLKAVVGVTFNNKAFKCGRRLRQCAAQQANIS